MCAGGGLQSIQDVPRCANRGNYLLIVQIRMKLQVWRDTWDYDGLKKGRKRRNGEMKNGHGTDGVV